VLPLRDNIPTARPPVVTYVFIAANILVYFLWQRGGISPGEGDTHYITHLWDWAAIPYEFVHPGEECAPAGDAVQCGSLPESQPPTWLTPFTSMFMHGGLLHLGGNMLFLWIFGNNVEDAMGPVKFVIFYLLAGLAALALQTLASLPGEESELVVPTVGASGAIAGVLGGYLLLFPRARVVTVIFIVFFFTIIELPALIVLGLWFVQQALMGYFDLAQPTAGGGVAYFAHIGGFVFGLLAIRLFARRKRRTAQFARG
jgi:membrane associated rhomboid family serine protease